MEHIGKEGMKEKARWNEDMVSMFFQALKKRYFLPDVPQPHQLAIHQDKLCRPPAALRNAHWLAPQYKVPQCSAHWHWLLRLLLRVTVSSLPVFLPH